MLCYKKENLQPTFELSTYSQRNFSTDAAKIDQSIQTAHPKLNIPKIEPQLSIQTAEQKQNIPAIKVNQSVPTVNLQHGAEKQSSPNNETNGLEAFELLRSLGSVS